MVIGDKCKLKLSTWQKHMDQDALGGNLERGKYAKKAKGEEAIDTTEPREDASETAVPHFSRYFKVARQASGQGEKENYL